jgi:biotin carboxyl carrier protein
LKKKVTFKDNDYIFEVLSNGNLSIDGEIFAASVDQEINSLYKVTINNHTFTVEVAEDDFIIDGEKVSISTKPYIPKRSINLDAQKDKKILIKAPIPGKIVQILVREGEIVEKNHELMILEAMKMRNRIFSPERGRVKKINIAVNENVEQDQRLVEFETLPS